MNHARCNPSHPMQQTNQSQSINSNRHISKTLTADSWLSIIESPDNFAYVFRRDWLILSTSDLIPPPPPPANCVTSGLALETHNKNSRDNFRRAEVQLEAFPTCLPLRLPVNKNLPGGLTLNHLEQWISLSIYRWSTTTRTWKIDKQQHDYANRWNRPVQMARQIAWIKAGWNDVTDNSLSLSPISQQVNWKIHPVSRQSS